MANGLQMTLDEFMPEISRKQIVGASDSLAKTSVHSTTGDLAFEEAVQACFSELCSFLSKSEKKKNPNGFSLKMLNICLLLITDGISPSFSLKWSGGGYDVQWQTLNSKEFGVPQNRERVFIVGHYRERGRREVFPVSAYENKTPILQVAEWDVERKNSTNYRVYSLEGIAPTLTATSGGGKNARVIVGDDIRKLTPKEYFRLQGWSDDYFDRAAFVNSDAQLYKQAGNGVTVNVIYEIAKRLERSNGEE